MKKCLWGMVIVLLCCSPVYAEKTIVTEFDGSDWQGWVEARKYNFLTGFLLGSSYIVKRNAPFMSKDYKSTQIDDIRKRLSVRYDKKRRVKPQTFSQEEVTLWGHYRASMVQNGLTDYAVYELTVRQLSQGMDDLYKDPKNVKIRLADALYLAQKQLKGADRDDIEKTLQFLRGD